MEQFKTPPAAAVARRWQAMMWLDADRVLYVGLLGEPSVRNLGAWSIYLSLSASRPHRVSLEPGRGTAWQQATLSVVPPGVPHRIVAGERMILSILIEAETIARDSLPPCFRGANGAVRSEADESRLRAALERVQFDGGGVCGSTADFDRAFFGAALAPRAIDRRIRTALDGIKRDPNRHTSAEECALAAHLSVSRFLHLFKDEVGSSFRNFRSWQRARSVLYHVKQNDSLANVALDVGYPDSTHFSHSVRQVFGLTPKSIFAGCRRLALYGSGDAARPRCGLAA
ncbi:helix-turn-helix domain-containing protein [Variovorax sp. PBL-E5]|uniref:helix-turn-helix domain-containing protein n=1 Tax=Variovorax sp. PBL-E5 TaxID=434014 RepID=UPI00131669AC|nr:AraC family transcriptional regulator [Variovorax sp. PBL-E5]VTU39925.1 DNA-binding transcriptional regulator AraC [Variovorax sp. PBL-E5]